MQRVSGLVGKVVLRVSTSVVSVALTISILSCTSQPVSSEKMPELGGVVGEALGTNLQGVYVVSAAGNDGQCDDTSFVGSHAAALQACIDKANADGGGLVLVRAGTYSTGAFPLTLKSRVTLRGQAFASKLAPSGTSEIVATIQDDTAIEGLVFDLKNLASGKAGIRFNTGVHRNVRIENNSFLPPTVTTGTYTGIGYELGNQTVDQIVIRGNSYLQPVATQTAVHLPVALYASNGTMSNIRIEDNNFHLNPHVSGGYIILSASGTPPATGIVISGNIMRSSGAGPGTGIVLLGGVEAQVTGNSIRAVSLISMGQALGGACSVLFTGNLMFGNLHAGPCGGGLTAVGNSDQHGIGVLTGKPAVLLRAYRSSNLNFTAGSATVVPFDIENVDLSGGYNPSTGVFQTQVGGWFRVRACARLYTTNFAAGDTADLSIVVGGSGAAFNRAVSGGSHSFSNCVEDLVQVTPNGSFRIEVNASGAANTRTISGTGTYSSYLTVERVSD